jgi:hypothetical protein
MVALVYGAGVSIEASGGRDPSLMNKSMAGLS